MKNQKVSAAEYMKAANEREQRVIEYMKKQGLKCEMVLAKIQRIDLRAIADEEFRQEAYKAIDLSSDSIRQICQEGGATFH